MGQRRASGVPTSAGKTFVAIRAIAETCASTLVVVPTIDLLHQWYACLVNAFDIPIGVWYGLEKQTQPITVTTYPSAWASAREYVQRLGRVLRKKGNEQAVLYEIIARNTVDEGIAQRRRRRSNDE